MTIGEDHREIKEQILESERYQKILRNKTLFKKLVLIAIIIVLGLIDFVLLYILSGA